MKSLSIIAALCLAAPVAWGQCANGPDPEPESRYLQPGEQFAQHSPTGQATGPRYVWYNHTSDPNLLMLWRGSDSHGWECAGILDPEAGSWKWTNEGKLHDLIATLYGPGRRDAGEKRGESGRGVGRGTSFGSLPPTKDDPPKPSPPASDSRPPDCKCGDGCECKDGIKGRDCTCPVCKCAIVAGDYAERKRMIEDRCNQRLKEAGLPPLPTKPTGPSPKGGVDEYQRADEDGRQIAQAGDVIDGSPRGKKDWMTGGVDVSQLRKGGSYYTINDKKGHREVDAAEALSAIEGGSIPDDAKNVRITVIGGDAARAKVVNDFKTNPSLAWLECAAGSGKCVLNSYPPTHWRIKDGGFKTPDAPDGVVIYAQQADGKVLWRQDSYEGGAETLARALRDKVPGYDPNKDPSPKKPGPALPDASPTAGGFNPWWLAVLAAISAAWMATSKKKAVPA